MILGCRYSSKSHPGLHLDHPAYPGFWFLVWRFRVDYIRDIGLPATHQNPNRDYNWIILQTRELRRELNICMVIN